MVDFLFAIAIGVIIYFTARTTIRIIKWFREWE